MSKSTTPKYVLEMSGFTSSAWKGRVPTVAKLEHEVMAFVVSTYPGFCNAHISKHCGIKIPARAVVRMNDHVGRILVEWNAPMFMALPDAKDFPKVARI